MTRLFTSISRISGLNEYDVFIVGKPKSTYNVMQYLGTNSNGKHRLKYISLNVETVQQAKDIARKWQNLRWINNLQNAAIKA